MISLVPPDALCPLVREHIAGAQDFMIRRALVDAAIEFCRASQLVQDVQGPVSVAAGETILLVPAERPYRAYQLLRVFGQSPSGPDVEQLIKGVDYLQLSGNQVLVNRPVDGLTVLFAVEPRFNALQIPAILTEDYSGALACGAVARMASQPGKAWSNPQLAEEMRPYFVDGYRAAFRWRTGNTAVNAFQNPVIKQEFF